MLIRKGTAADSPFLARSILIAGRAHLGKGIWEEVLNTNETGCLQFLQQITVTPVPHLFHYTCSLVAEVDNIPAGSLSAYNPRIAGYQALQAALPDVYRRLGLSAQASQGAGQRGARILACLPEGLADAWVIDSVATMPEFRGRGIAENLLRKVLDAGRNLGHSLSQVNMYIGNRPALNLYTKLGFVVKEEVRDKYFEERIGSPGMLSLVRPL
ncbi:MAG: GNAT family N-acetyltransferase [Desulfobulbales bacterium]|nr:GNAT family N-acetyltransferase [Desulfobulbales bacterium]